MVFKKVLRNISFKKKKDLVKERGHKIAEICNEDGEPRTRECSTKRGSIISRLSSKKRNKKKLVKLSKDGDAPNVITNSITSDAERKSEVFLNQYDSLIVKKKESSVEDNISEKSSSVGTLNTESVSTVPEKDILSNIAKFPLCSKPSFEKHSFQGESCDEVHLNPAIASNSTGTINTADTEPHSIFKSSNLDITAKPPSIVVGPNADDTLSAAKLASLADSKSIKDTGVGIAQEETRDGNLDIAAKPTSIKLGLNADDTLSAVKVASLAGSKSIKDTCGGITQEETRDGKSQVIKEKNHKITCWKDALINTLIDTYTCGDELSDIGEDSVGNNTGYKDSIENVRESSGNKSKVLGDELSDIGEDSVGNKTGFKDSIENVRESVENTSKVLDTSSKQTEKSFKKTPENTMNLEIKQRHDEVKDSEKQNSGYKESLEKDTCSGIEGILKIPDGVNSVINKKNNEGAPVNAVNLEKEQRSDEVKDSVRMNSGENSGDKESLEKYICTGIEGVLKTSDGGDLVLTPPPNERAILEVDQNNNGKDEKDTPRSDLPKRSKKVGNVLIRPVEPPIRKGRSCDGVTIVSTATLLVNEFMTRLAEDGFADYDSAVNTVNELANYIAEECSTYGNSIDKEVSAQLNKLLGSLNDINTRYF
eukprot:CAMPEP_0194275852 /NCGR_PEP_ID=MMETSP0169-20130528/8587_1 /TAXON_ID=218684 /ORGANISM="Corethron pennatum, Strain L29A3" /LENGTH=650 /DNA_ID=CAMNT_0039019419 /DNA_START=243 /DNA_END=2195 /DNA_ORIENTATION=+